MKAGSCVDSIASVSFIAGSAMATAGLRTFVERAIDDIGPADELGDGGPR